VPFPRISHVRQENNSDFWSLPTASLSLRNEDKSYLPKLKNGAKNNLGLNLVFTPKNLFDVKALPKIERLSVEQVHYSCLNFWDIPKNTTLLGHIVSTVHIKNLNTGHPNTRII
jgi:hypothetical protein